MNENNSAQTTGIGFFDALLLLLIALKFCGVITWPWWQVIALPFAILAGCVLASLVIAGVVALIGQIYLHITSGKDD